MAKNRVFHYVVSIPESRLGDFQEHMLLGEFAYAPHERVLTHLVITEQTSVGTTLVEPPKAKHRRKYNGRIKGHQKIKLLFREENPRLSHSSDTYKLWQILKKKYKNGEVITQNTLTETAKANKIHPSTINGLQKHYGMIERLVVDENAKS